jgi:hypothetical protein
MITLYGGISRTRPLKRWERGMQQFRRHRRRGQLRVMGTSPWLGHWASNLSRRPLALDRLWPFSEINEVRLRAWVLACGGDARSTRGRVKQIWVVDKVLSGDF